jgi:hypothetical protein
MKTVKVREIYAYPSVLREHLILKEVVNHVLQGVILILLDPNLANFVLVILILKL